MSPASRWSLVVGKAIAADFRGLVQAAVIYAIAFLMNVSIRWEPLAIAAVRLYPKLVQ